MSRSWTAPHRQVHARICNGSESSSTPHCEHVFVEGNHRSTAMSSRPYQAALYSSMDRSSDHDASLTARARLRLRTMFRTDRSSITIVWFSRTSRADSLCRWSRRRSALRAWMRATLSLALARLFEPICFFARRAGPGGRGRGW
jgi:hypothetical protein